MSDVRPLSDVAEINPSMPRSLRQQDEDDLVPFLAMSAVSQDGTASYDERRSLGSVLQGYTYFGRGDVLLAKITPCFENGKAAHLADLPGDIGFGSTEFHVVRPGPALDGRYLFHAIWNPSFRKRGQRFMTGTAGQKRLPAEFLRSYRLSVPPLAEQKRIATVLDKADGIRRKRRESLGLLDEFLHSAFLEMFGDPVRNEKGWEVVKLELIADVQGGLQVAPWRSKQERKVPYLRVANVHRDRLDLSEVKNLGVSDEELQRTRLEAGDLLIVEGHGNRDEIGRCAVWDGSIDGCVHQNHLIRVRLDATRAEPNYVSAFLNSDGGRSQMFRFGKTTSGLNTISTGNVKRVEIMLPPVDSQRRYLRLQLHAQASSGRVAAARLEADRLFGSLAQQAFLGEL